MTDSFSFDLWVGGWTLVSRVHILGQSISITPTHVRSASVGWVGMLVGERELSEKPLW